MDYEKIAAAVIQVMKAADLNRFLVVCAVVSDLYCPGYNPRQLLEKNSNLARTAARYRIDTIKVAVPVRKELSQKREAEARKPESPNASEKARRNNGRKQ